MIPIEVTEKNYVKANVSLNWVSRVIYNTKYRCFPQHVQQLEVSVLLSNGFITYLFFWIPFYKSEFPLRKNHLTSDIILTNGMFKHLHLESLINILHKSKYLGPKFLKWFYNSQMLWCSLLVKIIWGIAEPRKN